MALKWYYSVLQYFVHYRELSKLKNKDSVGSSRQNQMKELLIPPKKMKGVSGMCRKILGSLICLTVICHSAKAEMISQVETSPRQGICHRKLCSHSVT